MKRYVVLGVNENPIYLYYLPIVMWAWRKFGWETITFVVGELPKVGMIINMPIDTTYFIKPINGYKSETIAQVARLHASMAVKAGDYLLTSDADMLPLSNYHFEELNKPKPDYIKDGSGRFTMEQFVNNRPTAFGRDLTDYHYPICYIGMGASNWAGLMDNYTLDYSGMIKRDLDEYYPKAKNKWCVDQDIITDRLLKYGKEKITQIDRGTDKRTGYPIGRVDRSAWRLDHEVYIDAHLPHDILTNVKSFHNVLELLHTVWPKEDWKWFLNYTKEFKKLL